MIKWAKIRSNLNLEMLIFEEWGRPENPEKNLTLQGKEPRPNLTHAWPQALNRGRGHLGER